MYNLKGKPSLRYRRALRHQDRHGRILLRASNCLEGHAAPRLHQEQEQHQQHQKEIAATMAVTRSSSSRRRRRRARAPVEAANESARGNSRSKRAPKRQPKRAPVDVARKSTHWSSQSRWSSQEEQPQEQPRRAAAGAAKKSSRRSSQEEQPHRAAAGAAVTAVAGQQQPGHFGAKPRASYIEMTADEKKRKRQARQTEDWTRATSAERSVLRSRSAAEGSAL